MDTKPKDVADCFCDFLKEYDTFRKCNGLSGSIENVYEILTSMSDKHGRICRLLKHYERNDPKDNWEIEMSKSLTGFIVYSIMLLKRYNIDISNGIIEELQASIDQHSSK